MEVHAHTHPYPGSHRDLRKKWTHYFWEFLMLFLAVFAGFLAENQREHFIENQREKQYMRSFISDLQNDTMNLNAGFPLKDERLKSIDSIFLFFEKNPDRDSITASVFRQMRRSIWDRHYRRNSTTMDQLKNAGGLRLIRKRNIADSIAAYDLQWQRAEFWREGYITLQDKGKDFLHKIIDPKGLLSSYRQYDGLNRHSLYTSSVKIKTEYLDEFLNFLADQKTTTSQDWNGYKAIKQTAAGLIDLIKKEYHFK